MQCCYLPLDLSELTIMYLYIEQIFVRMPVFSCSSISVFMIIAADMEKKKCIAAYDFSGHSYVNCDSQMDSLQDLQYYWGFNSFWPSNAIWWLRFGSISVLVMACCLTAPSHYLNQCCIIISVSIYVCIYMAQVANISIYFDIQIKISLWIVLCYPVQNQSPLVWLQMSVILLYDVFKWISFE